MRTVGLYCACIALTASAAFAATPKRAAPPNPTEVALIEDGDKAGYYRFPTGERLYISDADPIGRSACNIGCMGAWQPVLAPARAKPIGRWTIVRREDGTRQWALKGKPVYSRFHDAPADPEAHDGWRLLSAAAAAALPH